MLDKTQAILANIQGVIFDLDGTLVDSQLNFSQIRAEVGCPEGFDTLKFIEALNIEQQSTANTIVKRHEMLDAAQSKALQGTKELLKKLNEKRLPQAIVTRNCVDATQVKLNNNQIAIDLVVTREQYPPKPAPDALLAVAKQWQIAPKNLMYVGDFRYDIEAGNNAGMVSCFISHGKTPDYSQQADLVFEQLSELASYF